MAGGKWRDSTRRQQLPPGWAKLRQEILERDSWTCQWPGCGGRATDVDHIVRGPDHSSANLRALCAYHHRIKSAQEGAAARTPATSRHPIERHPGLR